VLAGETGVPEGREVVRYMVDGMRGVDLPVLGLRGLGMGVVKETVWGRSVSHLTRVWYVVCGIWA
jgi:hypothetical protein